MIIYQVISIY